MENLLQKKFIYLLVYFSCCITASAQYYIRGEITDEKDRALFNVRIRLHSTNEFFYTGSRGAFGIPASGAVDSVTITVEGYEEQSLRIRSSDYQHIKMKLLSSVSSVQKQRLQSFTKDLPIKQVGKWDAGDETYAALVENETVDASKYPSTSFSLNVDCASYSNIRRFTNMDAMIPPDAVRIEEMLNYFHLNYHEPTGGNVFGLQSQVTDCPWNAKKKLLYLNISSKKLLLDTLPPANLVLLIDISGSMDLTNKLPLVKQACRKLVDNLRAQDTVAVVVYGGITGVLLNPTSGADKNKIMNVIDSLQAGGSTPGANALRSAYTLARSTFKKNGNNRIILSTDGDFNVGETEDKELEEMIAINKNSGVYLTCLGVGTGNLKDSKLAGLAKKGNGNYAYIDNLMEAEKVLVKEFTQNLYAVAEDVNLEMQFNAQEIKNYRLIGFDNKAGALADTSVKMEGREVGPGHSVTAMFEIEPADSLVADEMLAEIKLKYHLPGKEDMLTDNFTVTSNYKSFLLTDYHYQFASAIALYGMILRHSPYATDKTTDDVLSLALPAYDKTDHWQEEFIKLVQKSAKYYNKKKVSKGFMKKN